MQKVNTKKKIILAIIGLLILVVIALLIGRFTFSYLGADIGEDVKNEGEITASGDTIIFSKGNNLSLSATTDNFNATSGNLTDTTNPSVRLIASNKTNEASATYYAGIRILKNTFTYSSGTTAELILTVRDETGALVTTSSDDLDYVTVNGISGFDITGKTGAFNISSKHPINTNSSTSGTTHTWTFTLTFVNLETDQSINENATLDMDVVLQKDEIMPPTLAELCSGMTFAECIKEVVYTTDGESGLYYHDGVGSYTNADQEAGDNSYRYSGADPNNYVCFGSDADTCPNGSLYRIIGVFRDQLKLLKVFNADNSLLGTDGAYYSMSYRWNNSTNNNIWSQSNLNLINLNVNYINYLNVQDSKWVSMIETNSWTVGGNSENNIINVSAKQLYNNEIVNPITNSTYSAKIGLMYVSDYGYAVNPENWTTILKNYNKVSDYNWIYFYTSTSNNWTITRNSDSNNYAYSINYSGYLQFNSVNTNVCLVRPTFYLKSNILLVSGDGTKSSPFRVGV